MIYSYSEKTQECSDYEQKGVHHTDDEILLFAERSNGNGRTYDAACSTYLRENCPLIDGATWQAPGSES